MNMADDAAAASLELAGYGPPGGYGGPGGPPGAGPPPAGGYGGPPPGGYGPGAPPPGGGGYGAPPGGGFGGPGQFAQGGAGPRLHPLAIVSAVTGALSIPMCCCWFFSVPLPLCAIVCGIIALGKIKGNPQAHSGTVFCWIGMACGVLGLLMTSGFHLTSYGELLRHRYGRRF
jgi:hypothetical protein